MRSLISVAMLLAALTACGGESGPTAADIEASEAAASASEEAEREAQLEADLEKERKERAAEEAAQQERQQAAYDKCEASTRPLVNSLQQVSSRLSIGLSYSEYGEYIGDAKVAYDGLFDGPDLGRQCLIKVGIALEIALNNHIDVLNVWGACVDDLYCDFSEGEPNRKAQKKWAGADNVLARAKDNLAALAP